MCAHLRKRFPNANIIHGSVADLETLIPKDIHGNIMQIVSGLPMLNLPIELRKKVLNSSFDLMKDGGEFIQYSYVPFKPPYASDLECRKLDYTILNFPPAWIWSFRKSLSSL